MLICLFNIMALYISFIKLAPLNAFLKCHYVYKALH